MSLLVVTECGIVIKLSSRYCQKNLSWAGGLLLLAGALSLRQVGLRAGKLQILRIRKSSCPLCFWGISDVSQTSVLMSASRLFPLATQLLVFAVEVSFIQDDVFCRYLFSVFQLNHPRTNLIIIGISFISSLFWHTMPWCTHFGEGLLWIS